MLVHRPFRMTILGALMAVVVPGDAWAQALDPPRIYQIVYYPGIAPVRFGSAAWGDFDADGDYDLFYTGSLSEFDNPAPFSQLFINRGDIRIEVRNPEGPDLEPIEVPATDYIPGLSAGERAVENIWRGAVAWGDYDNDGDLDVLATGLTADGSRSVHVYENLPTSIRLFPSFSGPGLSDGAAAWGDYDNDGDLDFVISGLDDSGSPATLLYENQLGSGGGFHERSAGLVGLIQGSLAWGDYDNDGDLDLLVAGIAEPQEFVTRLYRNDGNGAFMEAGAGLLGLAYGAVAWGDMDADGDLDILLSGAEISPFLLGGKVLVYENDSGSFTPDGVEIIGAFENDPAHGRYRGNAVWGDQNNDGYLDFILTGLITPARSEAGQLWTYNGNRTFGKSEPGLKHGAFDGGYNGATFWGDYDNDNDLDIFVSGWDPVSGHLVRGLRNYLRIFPINRRPLAPGSLQAVVTGSDVDLSWSAGADMHTPTSGLTYNVRVGTTPGGMDVLSPMAVPETGQRLLSAMGNVQHNKMWTLKNLAPGVYYWSVQTIDASYKGSQFAAEGSFSVSLQ